MTSVSHKTRRYCHIQTLTQQYLSSWISPLFQPASKQLQDDQTSLEETDDQQKGVTPNEESEKERSDATRAAKSLAGLSRAQPGSNSNPSTDGFKVPSLPANVSKDVSNKRTDPSLDLSTEEEEDIDAPPQFPLPDSAQRSRAPAPKTETTRPESSTVPSFNVAPPSPKKDGDDEEPLSDLNIAIIPGTIPLGNMAPPPSTTSRPDFGMQSGGLTAPGGMPESTRKRAKVALGPGYSPLDWARLTQSGRNLRGIEGPMKVTIAELQKVCCWSILFHDFMLIVQHTTAHDAWTALDGIVYNITPYLRFHPGGAKEMLRTAGRDGTKLFSTPKLASSRGDGIS